MGSVRRVYNNYENNIWEYNIKCECHSPNHFEIITHCNACIPLEPKETKIILRTESLNKI